LKTFLRHAFAGILFLGGIGLFGEACKAAAPDQPLLGLRLEEAQQTDFFVFFHMEETSREEDSDNRLVVNFRPQSEAMAKVVRLRATLDKAGKISVMSLVLSRSFVDEDNSELFPNDITKSMLIDSLPLSDRKGIIPLSREIKNNKQLSDYSSLAYQTYLGKTDKYSLSFPNSSVLLQNIDKDGDHWLLIQVSKRKE